MKHSLPLAALLLASSFVPAVPALAAETGSEMIQPVEAADASELLAPIPPAVQKSMDRLFALQPELKKLHIVTSGTSERDGKFFVHLSNRLPEAEREQRGESSAYLEFDDKTGELLSFNLQLLEWASEKNPSRQLAFEAAERFLTQWFGAENRQQFGEPRLSGGSGSAIHHEDGTKTEWSERHVDFPLMLNGLPILYEGPQLGIDAFGHVVSYTYRPVDLDKVSAPKPDTAKSVEEIKQKIATADSLELNYVEAQPEKYSSHPYSEQKTKPVLKYDFLGYTYLHPENGKPIDILSGEEWRKDRDSSVSKKEITLNPQGQSLIVRSEEEAKQTLAKLFGVEQFISQLRRSEHFMTEEENSPYQSYNFETEDPRITLHAMVEKKTGRVQSASWSMYTEKEQEANATMATKEQALDTALAFLEKYAGPTAKHIQWTDFIWKELEPPAWVDKSKLSPEMMASGPNEYWFSFYELHEGIPVQDRSYSVTVDKRTGKVSGFSFAAPRDELNLPDAQNIVTKEQALKTFLKNKPLKLQYIWPRYMDQRAPSPILIYAWGHSEEYGYVDALTGQYVTVPMEWDEE
ncbi:YcdB/YcdC domain-containing protein [Aneurinibacillus thermoaerophilus]|uniref:YcdB/YcdC domain-containing protein n=1 Tax=Aneurinibacillus thermoaerophilus TaxID=143495 RepID=UPI002E1E269C|nr:hypothetical protein [Aneurinibacillus thermoaerophilus]